MSSSNQQGIVALITSIIVSLLLVVITSGAIAVTGGELRQATDYDNSIKAYFAAESGAEDAVLEIRRGLNAGTPLDQLIKDNCPPYNSDDANLSGDSSRTVSYTCQIVSAQQSQLSGEVRTEQSVQIDLSGALARFTQIELKWNQRGTSDPQNWNKTDIPTLFPPGTAWANTYPSVIEATIIGFPKASSFNSSDIKSRSVILKPANTNVSNPISPDSAAKPENINCTPGGATGSYDCTATLSGNLEGQLIDSSLRNYVVRLHARYSPAHYQLTTKGVAGNTVSVANAQLAIDVTGKSGDVFRRVLLRAPLSGQSQLNQSILANDTICKVLEVTDITNSADSETGCADNPFGGFPAPSPPPPGPGPGPSPPPCSGKGCVDL